MEKTNRSLLIRSVAFFVSLFSSLSLFAATDQWSFDGFEVMPYVGRDSQRTDVGKYVYLGNHTGHPAQECSFETLEEKIDNLKKMGASNQDVALHIQQDWLKPCDNELKSDQYLAGIGVLKRFTELKYDLAENPNVYSIKADLGHGVKIQGVLGLQPGKGKKPLIIANCGLQCEGNQGVVPSHMMMHLFDESPFHILILDSTSSERFSTDNEALALGGWVEGQYAYEVAEKLFSEGSPLKERFSELHYVGVSLGGHAAIYSGLFSQASTTLPFKSVLAVCPVIDLEPAIFELFSDKSLAKLILSFDLRNGLQRLVNNVPVLGRFFPEKYSKKPWKMKKQIRDGVIQGTLAHYKDWPVESQKERFTDINDVWVANDFFNRINEVRFPLQVVYSRNDSVVRPKRQSVKLLDVADQLGKDNIGVMEFSKGGHCAVPLTHGWNTYSTLLRSVVLYHSDQREELQVVSVKPFDSELKLERREHIANYYFQAVAGQNMVEVGFFTYMKSVACQYHSNTKRPCEENPVKIASISLESLGLSVPTTTFEAHRLSRWLNTHATLVSREGIPVRHQSESPRRVVLKGQYSF